MIDEDRQLEDEKDQFSFQEPNFGGAENRSRGSFVPTKQHNIFSKNGNRSLVVRGEDASNDGEGELSAETDPS